MCDQSENLRNDPQYRCIVCSLSFGISYTLFPPFCIIHSLYYRLWYIAKGDFVKTHRHINKGENDNVSQPWGLPLRFSVMLTSEQTSLANLRAKIQQSKHFASFSEDKYNAFDITYQSMKHGGEAEYVRHSISKYCILQFS